MYQSIGLLKYSNDPIKLIVQVDPDISNLYRSLIPKYFNVKRQMFAPHISVVRNIIPTNMNAWNKYNNKTVLFEYDSVIYNNDTYFWLNVKSKDLEKIRTELGMTPYGDVSLSPDSRHIFHITIGNIKKF
jgi:2'-5' RNA ligase